MEWKRKSLKRGTISILLVLLASIWICNPVNGATDQEIDQAISDGLTWLVSKQSSDGYFGEEYGYALAAKTGFAVLKLEEYAFEEGFESPFDPDYQYSQNLTDGLNYIFSRAVLIDTNGDSIDDALFFGDHLVYETSVVIMAIAAGESPDRMVPALGTPIDGWTYKQVLQYALNYLIYTQQPNGGWGYHHGDMWSDNSNTGYAVLGLMYAQNNFGLTIPDTVLSGLNNWTYYIQCSTDGGSGYESPCNWVNVLKTGNLLYEMAIVGETADSARVKAAISYIENHWNDASWDPGWKGGNWYPAWPEYQATYTMMKGFEAMNIKEINVSGIKIDWFGEVSTAIIGSQNQDGSWNSTNWGDQLLATEWALLTLEKAVEIPNIEVKVDIKPGSCPNPLNLKEKGVLPVAILGTAKFNVSDIDPLTIKISREGAEGAVVPSIRWGYEDVGTPFEGELCNCTNLNGDGYLDLTLKFDAQALVGTLELGKVAGMTVPLILTGNLKEEYGGTPIRGQDCIRVSKK